MNTLEAIARRVSVRKYRPEPVPEEDLQKFLKAGMQAPVASGAYDSVHLTVVQDPALLKDLAAAVNELIFRLMGRKMDKDFGAPAMVLVSAKPGRMPGVDATNAGCVAENMALAATDLGIASIVWGGAAVAVSQDPARMKKLGIPEGFAPVIALSLGYAAAEEPAKEHSITVNRV